VNIRSCDDRVLPTTHNERVNAEKCLKQGELKDLVVQNSHIGRLLQDRNRIKLSK
jgi:hypothetical protein